jgi:hypothetical protein
MAEKLRSISARIPWSLAVKAAIFGFAWYALPRGWFVVVALLLYCIPLFRIWRSAIPFATLLVLADIIPSGPYALYLAAAFGGAYFLLDGVKNLAFIDRHAAYRTLVLLLMFAAVAVFFSRATCAASGPCPTPGSAVESLLVAALIFLFVREVLRSAAYHGAPEREPDRFARASLAAGLVAILLWEFLWTLLFLPLNFFSQTALAFLAVVVLLELAELRVHGRLARRAILLHASIFVAFLVILLAANSWTV